MIPLARYRATLVSAAALAGSIVLCPPALGQELCCSWSGVDTGGTQCCPLGYVCGNPGCALPPPQPSGTVSLVCPTANPVSCGTGRCCDRAHPNCCGDGGCCDTDHPYCCESGCCDAAHPYCCSDGKCSADLASCSSGCPKGYALAQVKGWCCPEGLPFICNDRSCDVSPNCHGVGAMGTPDPRNGGTSSVPRDGGP